MNILSKKNHLWLSEQFKFGFIFFLIQNLNSLENSNSNCYLNSLYECIKFATLRELNFFFVTAVDYILAKSMKNKTRIHDLITILLLVSGWNSSQLEMTMFITSEQFSDFPLIFAHFEFDKNALNL